MASLAVSLASAIVRAAQNSPFKGLGDGYGATDEQLASDDPETRFRQAFAEAAGVGDFYAIFPELPQVLPGQDLLDFGCGYGGKTVEYARLARFAAGIEPKQKQIDVAEGFAEHLGVTNCEFKVCPEDTIPYPDERFDIVLSHDVIEHVADPQVSLAEITRVLRPGGMAYIAFPPYDGILSHHLDYASRVPAMHLLFSPETLVEVVNREITRRGLATPEQPRPKRSWDGSRPVVPGLNGLTSSQFERIAGGLFAKVEIERRPVAKYGRGAAAVFRNLTQPLGKLDPAIREVFTAGLFCRLTKAA